MVSLFKVLALDFKLAPMKTGPELHMNPVYPEMDMLIKPEVLGSMRTVCHDDRVETVSSFFLCVCRKTSLN